MISTEEEHQQKTIPFWGQTKQSVCPQNGLASILGRFLRQAGCTSVSYKSHVIDYSFGSPAYEDFRQDAASVFQLFQPFLVRMGVATQGEVDQLYQQMRAEMQREDFCGLLFPLTAWGQKSARRGTQST